MSKYTTEVRFICEQYAGFTDSKGGNYVDTIIDASWNKIFDESWNTFNSEHKQVLCRSILRHYYTREIGMETVALWKMKINQTLVEIMPYYNNLYEIAGQGISLFDDTNFKISGNRKDNYSENTNKGSSSESNRVDNLQTASNGNSSTNDSSTGYTLENDTPQGGLEGVDTLKYLSKATKMTDTSNSQNSAASTVKNTGNQTTSNSTSENAEKGSENLNEYSEKRAGKSGGKTYAELIKDYKEQLAGIDLQIINDLSSCFMCIY